jgi:hypothetical protein
LITLTPLIIALLFQVPQPSQPPSPTPSTRTQEQQKTSGNKKAGKADNATPSNPNESPVNQALPNKKTNNPQHTSDNNEPSSALNDDPLRNWLTIAFTFVLTVFAALQFWAMHRQARYMRDGLALTKQAADAATKSAEAAESAAKATAIQFEVAQRPWISVTVVPDGPLRCGNDSANVTFKVTMKNTGSSVATDVLVYGKLFPLRGDPTTEIDKRQCALCDKPAPWVIFSGFYVFPGEQREWGMGTSTPITDIESEWIFYPEDPSRKFISLYLVGCIDYRLSFSKEQHQTRFAYQLSRLPSAGGPVDIHDFGSFEVGKDVPCERLWLTPWLSSGNYVY